MRGARAWGRLIITRASLMPHVTGALASSLQRNPQGLTSQGRFPLAAQATQPPSFHVHIWKTMVIPHT